MLIVLSHVKFLLKNLLRTKAYFFYSTRPAVLWSKKAFVLSRFFKRNVTWQSTNYVKGCGGISSLEEQKSVADRKYFPLHNSLGLHFRLYIYFRLWGEEGQNTITNT